jgi:uncharacterized membrane protein YjfL (UPF0719 family)
MSLESLLAGVAIAFFKLLVGLVLSIGSVYFGIYLLDKLTPNIDEWKEIKKGNFSVGVLLGGIVLSIAVIIQGVVASAINSISPATSFSIIAGILLVACIKLLIGLIVSVFAIYLALRVLDNLTPDLDEIAELKKGNIAVATVMATIMIAIAFVIQSAVNALMESIDFSPFLTAFGI